MDRRAGFARGERFTDSLWRGDALNGDDWRCWLPVRRRRRLLCRQHWWHSEEWGGQPRVMALPRVPVRFPLMAFPLYFDVSGRLLREGAAVIPLRHPGESYPDGALFFEPVRTHEIHILDKHLGAGLVELTNEYDYFSCTARHLDLVTISFMRDVGLRWRRKASFRNHCRQALCIPSILLPYMELKDMLYFRRAGRECWKPGMSERECWKIIWPQRQL